jgi:ubiquinone/menaquinone biosynthesis C-methylase UbiE
MFEANVRKRGLDGRLQFHAGDFFTMPLPSADVIVLGRILHNWNLDIRRMLLAKVYSALPAGGVLIVHETLIPEDRRSSAAGMLAGLNMLLWTAGGNDFTGSECAAWMAEAGFNEIRIEPLATEQSMVIGKKL